MSFEEVFNNGVSSFQAKEFDKASTYFTQALDLQPENTTVLVNLALAHYQAGQKTIAFAYYKKAAHLDPFLSTAQQGLDFVRSQIQIREVPHRIETYERMRNYFVEPFSVLVPLAISAVLFFIWGLKTIRHYGNKKRAYLAGEDPAAYGPLNLLLCLLFAMSLVWVGFFKIDSSIQRGIVKMETLSVKSSPLLTAPEVLQIYGGLEVQILRHQDGWLQIEFPGSIAGWVEPGSIIEY
jgi:tetratricopeptide (TPR) repeat protein